MYLEIKENSFSELREQAIKVAEKNYGKERKDELDFDNIEMSDQEIEFEKDIITCSGDMVGFKNGQKVDLGYLSLDIKLDLDLAVEIIEFYMKKLGKLKTVLEATK